MKKEKILIVDDEADIALILKLQLEDAGYVTVKAHDGIEALEAAERKEFDLVLLDIKMPRMSGIEVLEKLISEQPEVAIIMMTAHGSEDIAVESMKKGALDYISKPFSTDDLLKKVERTLQLSKARRENLRLQQQLEEERKKMEAMLNGMADLLVAVDKDGLIMTINRKAEILLGVAADSCVGMPVENLIKADIPSEALPCKVVLQTLAPCLDVTYRLSVKKGKSIPVLSSATPLLNHQRKLQGSVEIIRDISVLKALEQEREEFVSMLTHDLKTPLTAVFGSIDLVREERLGKINDEQKEYLESAMESCAEIVEMIDTLLDLYRFEAGKMTLAFSKEDPVAVIQKAVGGFRSLAERSEIRLKTLIEGSLPSIMVDRNKFLRLLNNLLSNAFKFTGSGGDIEVGGVVVDGAEVGERVPKELYPNQVPEKGRFLKISVRDTGIGIPADVLPIIFEKFVQGKSRLGKNKGTGLGLAFCRKVMDSHGGFIWAESELSRGSNFIVLFPLNQGK